MFKKLSVIEYFSLLVTQSDEIPLLEAAVHLGLDEYPDLEIAVVLSQFDQHCQQLALRCKDASTEIKRLQIALHYFYREMGFAGNVNDYYDPNNSYLSEVLRRRRGIPISLAILFVEMVKTVGLEACGVSFPGHFLAKVNLHEGPVVIDPFSGRSLTGEDILERLDPYRQRLGLVGENEIPTGLFLQAASEKEILLRMLRNLREIYRQKGDESRLVKVLNRILVIEPDSTEDRALLSKQ